MSVKMKGLMKGFKYIEKFFEEEEKEKEISIGFPTDVKHVAHIGFDGPSASSPSWMNDFKGNESENSAGNNDDPRGPSQDASPKKISVRDSPGRDLPGLPRSRRQASTESVGSIDSNADSPKQSKSKASRKSRQTKQKDNSSSPKAGDASSLDLPNVPKKSRRKKTSKDSDSSERKASRSKEKGSSRHGGSRHGSDDGSISKHSFVEEPCPSSSLSTLNED